MFRSTAARYRRYILIRSPFVYAAGLHWFAPALAIATGAALFVANAAPGNDLLISWAAGLPATICIVWAARLALVPSFPLVFESEVPGGRSRAYRFKALGEPFIFSPASRRETLRTLALSGIAFAPLLAVLLIWRGETIAGDEPLWPVDLLIAASPLSAALAGRALYALLLVGRRQFGVGMFLAGAAAAAMWAGAVSDNGFLALPALGMIAVSAGSGIACAVGRIFGHRQEDVRLKLDDALVYWLVFICRGLFAFVLAAAAGLAFAVFAGVLNQDATAILQDPRAFAALSIASVGGAALILRAPFAYAKNLAAAHEA